MLTRRIIPCLDVRDGRGGNSRTAMNGSPRRRAPGHGTAGPAPRTRDGFRDSRGSEC